MTTTQTRNKKDASALPSPNTYPLDIQPVLHHVAHDKVPLPHLHVFHSAPRVAVVAVVAGVAVVDGVAVVGIVAGVAGVDVVTGVAGVAAAVVFFAVYDTTGSPR